jgi:TonB-linked SusC/RagA family outer membrane protein
MAMAMVVWALFSGGYASAQSSATYARGRITDAATKQPVVGAQVRTADGASSALTNENGAFRIKIQTGKEILEVVSPDYALREVPLLGKDSVNIEVYAEMFATEYSKVETLLGEEAASTLTNKVSSAGGFEFSPATTLDSEIQGRLGGTLRTITRSGLSGIGANMFIRGFNSLNANAQPLFVIDGVVWDSQLDNSSVHLGYFSNPLAAFDVKDIESITVLSDGNSLYGSKAANGVVLVKTKRGVDQVTRISANLSYGMNDKPKITPVMNASQYRIYASNQAQGFMEKYNYLYKEIEQIRFLEDDPSKSYYNTYHNDSNWADEIYNRSNSLSANVNINGGDDIALYNLSMGFTQNDGVMRTTDMQRLNARFNSDIKMTSKMLTKVDIAITQTQRNLRDDGINLYSTPGFISLIKAPILSSHQYIKSTGELSPKLEDYDELDPGNPVSNPVAVLENSMGKASDFYFNINVHPTWQFTKNLKLGSLFSYRFNKKKESFFIPQAGTAPQELQASVTVDNEVRDYTQRQMSVFSDTRLDWVFRLNDVHKFDVSGGFRYMADVFESDLPKGYNTGNDNVMVLFSGIYNKSVNGVNEAWKSMSWYANANYNLYDKYLANVTVAADASSRFGSETEGGIKALGTTWALFPSIGAAWIVSHEDFLADNGFLNFLKLRANFGITGNDDIDNYTSRSFFQTVNWTGRGVGLQIANIRNEAIQWETSTKLSAGLDLAILNERINISADVFQSKTSNLLTLKSLKQITGLGYYWTNGGELENTGFEASFNAKVVNTNWFKWELGASAGHYKNKITALPDGNYTTSLYGGEILTAVGQPAGVFYGYKTDGVFSTTAEAEAANISRVNTNGTLSPYQAGDVRFVEVKKDGLIDTRTNDDKQIIGDPNPDLYGSITNRFQVKRLQLDVLFAYSLGNDVYNYQRSLLESGASMYNQSTAMLNRWTAEGQKTDIPRAVYGDPMGNAIFSDRWIEDGSYLRLKTVSLSYELPVKIPFLQGVTVWAAANNLLTLTRYLGSDPEVAAGNGILLQGIDAGLLPQSRSYFVGVKINL